MATSAGYEVAGGAEWVPTASDEQGRTLWAPTEFAWIRRLSTEEDEEGHAVGGQVDIGVRFRFGDGRRDY